MSLIPIKLVMAGMTEGREGCDPKGRNRATHAACEVVAGVNPGWTDGLHGLRGKMRNKKKTVANLFLRYEPQIFLYGSEHPLVP